jgi:hypothetical protein
MIQRIKKDERATLRLTQQGSAFQIFHYDSNGTRFAVSQNSSQVVLICRREI